MGETSSIVSLRPPFAVSTSQSNERRWISMRFGTSATFSRRENDRRGGAASTRAKAGPPSRSRQPKKPGRAERAQKTRPTRIADRNPPPQGAFASPQFAGSSAITDPVPRHQEYGLARLSKGRLRL